MDDRVNPAPSRRLFIAIAVAILNPRRSEAVVAWAGIEPPLMLRANGDVWALRGGGPPLGVNDKEVYAEVTIPFHQGDTLVMSTDGLSEARSVSQQEFLGQEGVIELLKSAQTEPSLKAISEALLGGAKAFAGGQGTGYFLPVGVGRYGCSARSLVYLKKLCQRLRQVLGHRARLRQARADGGADTLLVVPVSAQVQALAVQY